VDLAGLPTNPTGVAVMQDGRLVRVQSTHTDDEIAAIVRECGRSSVVAINAPLGLPHGRCCLDDACRCRFDPGTRSRAVERQLARERVPTLATALIKVLARRGISLASCLRATGYCVIEAYPYATLRLLGLPAHGKRSRAGRAAIMAALSPLVPGLDHPDASEHELDAVVCALTADLWLRLRCREVGDPEEGQMMVPLQAAHRYGESAPPRPARVAEHGAPYDIGAVSTVGHAEGGD
jgi:predicted nuclease with RNAse H fold